MTRALALMFGLATTIAVAEQPTSAPTPRSADKKATAADVKAPAQDTKKTDPTSPAPKTTTPDTPKKGDTGSSAPDTKKADQPKTTTPDTKKAEPPVVKSADTPKAAKAPKAAAIDETWACAQECLKCMNHCRAMKMEDTAKICETCHHACLLAMMALQNNYSFTTDALEACEKTCLECAKMCEKHDHPETKKCAEECRKCAKACADARK